MLTRRRLIVRYGEEHVAQSGAGFRGAHGRSVLVSSTSILRTSYPPRLPWNAPLSMNLSIPHVKRSWFGECHGPWCVLVTSTSPSCASTNTSTTPPSGCTSGVRTRAPCRHSRLLALCLAPCRASSGDAWKVHERHLRRAPAAIAHHPRRPAMLTSDCLTGQFGALCQVDVRQSPPA